MIKLFSYFRSSLFFSVFAANLLLVVPAVNLMSDENHRYTIVNKINLSSIRGNITDSKGIFILDNSFVLPIDIRRQEWNWKIGDEKWIEFNGWRYFHSDEYLKERGDLQPYFDDEQFMGIRIVTYDPIQNGVFVPVAGISANWLRGASIVSEMPVKFWIPDNLGWSEGDLVLWVYNRDKGKMNCDLPTLSNPWMFCPVLINLRTHEVFTPPVFEIILYKDIDDIYSGSMPGN